MFIRALFAFRETSGSWSQKKRSDHLWERTNSSLHTVNVLLGRRRRRAALLVPYLYETTCEARVVSWAAGVLCPVCAAYKYGPCKDP